VRVRVLKFGGTLLAGAGQRAELVGLVGSLLAAGVQPVLVVSAMGRSGDPYATDTLLGLLTDAGGEPEAATADQILSCGETISAALVAHTLHAAGCPAEPFTAATAGIRTTSRADGARPLSVDAEGIRSVVRASRIPVVAGFQGVDRGGRVTTLGRGGSDLTAVLLGDALDAEVEIVKDVDGVMTADPRHVPGARHVRRIGYASLCTLLASGSGVVQLEAARTAWRRRIRLTVRGIASTEGTRVMASGQAELLDERGRAAFAIASRPEPGLLALGGRALAGRAPACARVSVVLPAASRRWLGLGSDALGEASIAVLGSCASSAAISFLVPEREQVTAAAVLHCAFERALAGDSCAKESEADAGSDERVVGAILG
jgi:aspartate kinase